MTSVRVESELGGEARTKAVVEVHLPEHVVGPWPMHAVATVRNEVVRDSLLGLVGGERPHDRVVRMRLSADLPEPAVADRCVRQAVGVEMRRGRMVDRVVTRPVASDRAFIPSPRRGGEGPHSRPSSPSEVERAVTTSAQGSRVLG